MKFLKVLLQAFECSWSFHVRTDVGCLSVSYGAQAGARLADNFHGTVRRGGALECISACVMGVSSIS